MDQLSAVIKNNDHNLKTCILYEALHKKPIFDSYRKFCNLVGQDAMEYPDFEFWYYRFYRGEMDFDYDRSADPTPKTIMDMPVKLMYKIIESLDTVERTYLRSMNRSIKDIVDSRPPSFEKIEIIIDDTGMGWDLDEKKFICEQNDKGCLVEIPNFPHTIKDEYFLKKGLKYLSPVLKMPNLKVNHLFLHIIKDTVYLSNLLPIPFHVKSVSILAFDINKSLELLSAMNPGELESISFDTGGIITEEDVLEIYETEQFKQAKIIESQIFLEVDNLRKFSHLESFRCPIFYREPRDFQRIRDIISTFKQFKSCKLERSEYGNHFDIRTVAEALEAEIPFGPLKTITYRYRIPESNEFLKFKIKEDEYRLIIKIVKIS